MNSMGNVTEIPFDLPGTVYRGCMPYTFNWRGKDDPIDTYQKTYQISCIVMLTTEEEGKRYTQRDLAAYYIERGLNVIHFPIKDFSTPPKAELAALIEQIHRLVMDRNNVLVHCFSGKGRTGLVLACLARKTLGFSGEESVSWLRKYIPGAVETPEQKKFVAEYIPTEGAAGSSAHNSSSGYSSADSTEESSLPLTPP